ncbi:uncharacterized protein C8R40DRAFT_1068059 [Lentinula edodes]|uniref:uncharacterized protein n=1 Tax=Lentinula edodes TaxID=5353 RepID=UPI001E8E3DB2|nr:uncharacterized protein C8R40DRAFT_1068059 [Lentinula edodes]KAH7877359.1 hypothetical protein C8R40DRAFT_1068059 [Lentinula edodes]KAJ3912027.1 hypothetical protein F5877DRAFT_72730 [Lentinula edodes]
MSYRDVSSSPLRATTALCLSGSHSTCLWVTEYQLQPSPLMPDDLLQTYALLVAGKKVGKKMFAFHSYNGPPIESLAGSISLESPGSIGDDLSLTSMGFADEGLGKILRSMALQSVHGIQVAGSTRDIDVDAPSML